MEEFFSDSVLLILFLLRPPPMMMHAVILLNLLYFRSLAFHGTPHLSRKYNLENAFPGLIFFLMCLITILTITITVNYLFLLQLCRFIHPEKWWTLVRKILELLTFYIFLSQEIQTSSGCITIHPFINSCILIYIDQVLLGHRNKGCLNNVFLSFRENCSLIVWLWII